MINILAADKLFLRPNMYSVFLLWMLAELYELLPEQGDKERGHGKGCCYAEGNGELAHPLLQPVGGVHQLCVLGCQCGEEFGAFLLTQAQLGELAFQGGKAGRIAGAGAVRGLGGAARGCAGSGLLP